MTGTRDTKKWGGLILRHGRIIRILRYELFWTCNLWILIAKAAHKLDRSTVLRGIPLSRFIAKSKNLASIQCLIALISSPSGGNSYQG